MSHINLVILKTSLSLYCVFLMKNILRIFCFGVVVFASSEGDATVFEFGSDGTVVVYEATDYLASKRHQKFKKNIKQLTLISKHSDQFDDLVLLASRKYGVEADLIHAVIAAESSHNPNAVSSKGAGGLMQLMPGTAEQYGVSDVFSPEENIEGGTKYLRFLLDRYDGDTDLVLAAYNSGEGTVDRYGDVPPYPETKAYVARVSSYLNKIQTKEREDE
jgi:soluble lytic murein transglycosylase-like protein